MSQGGNWSRMMSDNVDVDDIAILPMGTQPSQPNAVKRRPICAANYTPEEDLQLCESWENISLILSLEMSNLAKRIGSEFMKTFMPTKKLYPIGMQILWSIDGG